MKIAVILNAHGDTPLVLDTIDAIKTWVTDDILVVIDGAARKWSENVDLPVVKLNGFRHNCPKSPYRNVTLGMMETVKKWPDADWYCYMEYDVLFTSSEFKRDLEFGNKDLWCIGNDSRHGSYKFPLLETITKMKFNCSKYLLGCCVFHRGKFLRKLQDMNFFERLLYYTNDFDKGFFPGYDGYDFAEHLYPTLAHHLGGKVGHFASWGGAEGWSGNYLRYPMRWKPELSLKENFKDATIMHPLKSVDHPIREHHRINRIEYKRVS